MDSINSIKTEKHLAGHFVRFFAAQVFVYIVALFFFPALSIPIAYADSSGPLSPGTMADDSSVGSQAWTGVSFATANDGQYATTSAIGSNGVTTHYLKATNFGFNIPSDATVSGIVLDINRTASGSGSSPVGIDSGVLLVKGGTITGTNEATTTQWATSTGIYYTYGSSTDLWGLSFTPTDINSSTFGAVLSAKCSSGCGAQLLNPKVDHMRITVYYTVPTPPTVTAISVAGGRTGESISGISVTGADFTSGATVALKQGGSTINGTGFTFSSSTSLINGSFNLSGAATGLWDVWVTKTDNTTGTLANGFLVSKNVQGPFTSRSTSFIIDPPSLHSISGWSSSTSFKNLAAAGQNAIGKSSSTSFKVCAGQLCSLADFGGPNPANMPFLAGYRWYANADSSSTGAALAAVNTTTTAPAQGTGFRLRTLLHVPTVDLTSSSLPAFKLQTAQRSGTCDTGWSGETYADLATSTGAIRYADNASVANAVSIVASSSDPTHGNDTVVDQTYQEQNNFTATSTVYVGSDALWDFSLVDFSATAGTTYCFRVVDTNNASATPEFVPEITTTSTVATISVTGRVFSDEGVTTVTSTVSLSINGGTKITTSTLANGLYNFPSVTQPSASDTMTIWMDNNGGGNGTGALVTRYDTGNLSSMNIYKNQLITRHEDAGPINNTGIGLCTKTIGSGCADSDLHFDVSAGALTIDSDWGLYLWAGKTFTPGGAVTLANGSASSTSGGDVKWASSTSVLSLGTNALSVGGDFNNDAGGTFTVSGTQTTTFTATTTGFRINSGNQTFRNVTFNGAGGVWSAATSTLTIGQAASGANLTMTAGTLDNSNGTSSIAVNSGSVTGSGGVINLSDASFTLQLRAVSTSSFGSTSGDWTFNDLAFSDSSTTATTFRYTTQTSGTGNIIIGKNLILQSSPTAGNTIALDLGNRTWTLNGTDGTPIDITATGGAVSFEPVSSTVVYAGNNPSGVTTVASTTYYSLTTSGGDLYQLAASTTADGLVTVSGGSTFDLNGSNLVAGNGLTVANATMQGSADVLVKSTIQFSGTGTANFTTPSTFEQRISTTTSFTVSNPAGYTSVTFSSLKFTNSTTTTSTLDYNVSVPGSGMSITNELSIGNNSTGTINFAPSVGSQTSTISLTGNSPGGLNIGSKGVFSAGTSTILLAGDVTVDGTFNPSTSLVYFNSGVTSTIAGTSTKELGFYNFKTDVPNKALVFATSTQAFRIDGLLTLAGASGSPVTIDSNSSGTQWLINHQGTESVTYASVKDSGCVSTSTAITNTSTTDRGNNGSCWFNYGITVSGTVYSNEGASTTTSTVKLAVGSSTSYSTSTNASGTYSFTNVTAPATGAVLTVWMDNNGGGNGLGATVTRATSTGNITGLDVYKSRLIVRHEDNGPLTNTDMSLCDKTTGSACADSDLHFEVTTSTSALAVDNDWALYLWGGKTFTPGGAVTLANGSASSTAGGDLKWASSTSVISLAANALSIGGDWDNTASGTFTITAGQTTTFTATTTGFTVARPGTFENLTFNGSGGGWTFTTSGATTTLDLTVATGTLNIVTSTLDVNGNMTIGTNGTFQASTTFNIAKNLANSGTFSVGSSTAVFDTTATSTITNSSTMNFWNFQSQTGAKPLVFGANQTFGVNGQLLVTGVSGSRISIDSTASGTQWLINHQGTEAVSYVTVKDSGCVSTSTYISVSYADSVDRGNNGFCWLFPSLSFTISPLTVSLTLNDANTFTSSATNTLTVTTNAGLGYNLTAFETDLLARVSDSTTTISNWTGTNAAPTTWTTTCIASSSNCGFGYSTNDADLTQFSSTKFAGFTTSTPGDTVASAASQVTSDATVMTYRTSVDLTQKAGDYQTTIRYIAAPKF